MRAVYCQRQQQSDQWQRASSEHERRSIASCMPWEIANDHQSAEAGCVKALPRCAAGPHRFFAFARVSRCGNRPRSHAIVSLHFRPPALRGLNDRRQWLRRAESRRAAGRGLSAVSDI